MIYIKGINGFIQYYAGNITIEQREDYILITSDRFGISPFDSWKSKAYDRWFYTEIETIIGK